MLKNINELSWKQEVKFVTNQALDFVRLSEWL